MASPPRASLDPKAMESSEEGQRSVAGARRAPPLRGQKGLEDKLLFAVVEDAHDCAMWILEDLAKLLPRFQWGWPKQEGEVIVRARVPELSLNGPNEACDRGVHGCARLHKVKIEAVGDPLLILSEDHCTETQRRCAHG